MGFLVVESVYDLKNWPEPWVLEYLDVLFTIAYVLDIVLKLLVDSAGTVFSTFSNRFDLYSTIVIVHL